MLLSLQALLNRELLWDEKEKLGVERWNQHTYDYDSIAEICKQYIFVTLTSYKECTGI
jgi:hypothetical protein